jgi:mRNA (guanine-N7-)-methyltransferase
MNSSQRVYLKVTTQIKNEINNLLNGLPDILPKDDEIELRFGTINGLDNHFNSSVSQNTFFKVLKSIDTLYIPQGEYLEQKGAFDKLLKTNVAYTNESIVTRILSLENIEYYPNNIRSIISLDDQNNTPLISTRKYQQKQQSIGTSKVDLCLSPYAVRLTHSIETDNPTLATQKLGKPSMIRSRRRITYKFDKYSIEFTKVNNNVGKKSPYITYEIEIEFHKLPNVKGRVDEIFRIIATFLAYMTDYPYLLASTCIDAKRIQHILQPFASQISNPVNLKSRDLPNLNTKDWAISSKLDGINTWMTLSADGAFLHNNIATMGIPVGSSLITSKECIVVGELITIHQPVLSYRYEIYDVCKMNGEIITNKSYIERLAYLTDSFIANLNKKILEGYTIRKNTSSRLIVNRKKVFFNGEFKNSIEQALHSYSDLPSDGLIFTPIMPTANPPLKWKPPQDLTIDFKIRRNNDNIKFLPIVMVKTTDKNMPDLFYYKGKTYLINFENTTLIPDTSLVYECAFNTSSQEFIPRKIRYDKSNPNYVDIATDVMDDVMAPITLEMLLAQKYNNAKMYGRPNWEEYEESDEIVVEYEDVEMLPEEEPVLNTHRPLAISPLHLEPRIPQTNNKTPSSLYNVDKRNAHINSPTIFKSDCLTESRKYHNQIKTALINTYTDNKYVLDLGIGRGGDIGKYKQAHTLGVFGVDVNEENLKEAFQRNEKTYHMKNLFLNLISATNTDAIQTELNRNFFPKVDVVSTFFSLSFFFKNQQSLNELIESFKIVIPGGHVIGTSVDMTAVSALLNDSKNPDEYISPGRCFQIKRLGGNKILFHVEDSIVQDQEEYLVDFNMFETSMRDAGFSQIVSKEFSAANLQGDSQIFSSLFRQFVFVRNQSEEFNYSKDLPIQMDKFEMLNPNKSMYFNFMQGSFYPLVRFYSTNSIVESFLIAGSRKYANATTIERANFRTSYFTKCADFLTKSNADSELISQMKSMIISDSNWNNVVDQIGMIQNMNIFILDKSRIAIEDMSFIDKEYNSTFIILLSTTSTTMENDIPQTMYDCVGLIERSQTVTPMDNLQLYKDLLLKVIVKKIVAKPSPVYTKVNPEKAKKELEQMRANRKRASPTSLSTLKSQMKPIPPMRTIIPIVPVDDLLSLHLDEDDDQITKSKRRRSHYTDESNKRSKNKSDSTSEDEDSESSISDDDNDSDSSIDY